MFEYALNQRQRGTPMTSRKMPCLILRSESNFSPCLAESRPSSLMEELAQLRARKEGFLRGGLLMPLGWRELLEVDEDTRPAMDTDDWEEDDDIVDDDDDDDEDEEEEDEDFFPDDDDEFDEEEDDDDDDEDDEEDEDE